MEIDLNKIEDYPIKYELGPYRVIDHGPCSVMIAPLRNTVIDQIWMFLDFNYNTVKVYRRQREDTDHKWNDWELLSRIV